MLVLLTLTVSFTLKTVDMPNSVLNQFKEKAGLPKRPLWRRVLGLALSLLLAALAVGLTAGGTLLLHTRAQVTDEVAALPPTIVLAATVRREGQYQQERWFTGRIESARQTDLAFELSGRLIELMVDEGQLVAAGDPVAKIDRAALELRRQEQQAARRALETDRRLALLESRRQRQLKGDGYASGQAFDEARLRVAGLTARIDQVDAVLKAIDLDLSKTILRAPFDAIVGRLSLERGAIVSAGVPVLTVFERGRPQVRVGLPQRLAASLQRGQMVSLVVGERKLRARLTRLRPDLNAQTQTVAAILEIDDPALIDAASAESMALLYGQSAQLNMIDSVTAEGFWIPLTALREGERGLWTISTLTPEPRNDELYRVGSSAVQVLHVDGDRAFVRGGPADGEHYVSTGLHRLSRGGQVRVEFVPESP